MKSGVKKNKVLKIHSPLALFQSDQQNCTEIAIVDQAQSTVPIVVNKHQLQALCSNPNANISISNKKRKKLLKRLLHSGLISNTNKANMMAVEIARPTNPFHFNFTRERNWYHYWSLLLNNPFVIKSNLGCIVVFIQN